MGKQKEFVTVDEAKKRAAELSSFMRDLGRGMVERARRTFDEQRGMDGTYWPEQYPNQGDDFVHLAGLVADILRGSKPTTRFKRQPAGVDTGELRDSITFALTGPKQLKVLALADHAEDFEFGATSSQPITDEVRSKIAAFLKGNPQLRPAIRQRIGWMLAVKKGTKRADRDYQFSQLTTKSNPRPIFRTPPDMDEMIADRVKAFLQFRDVDPDDFEDLLSKTRLSMGR